MLQLVVGSEDIPLRTDNGHAPSRVFKWFVEHVTGLLVDVHHTMARLACQHRLTNMSNYSILMFHRLREHRLIEQFRGVGVY